MSADASSLYTITLPRDAEAGTEFHLQAGDCFVTVTIDKKIKPVKKTKQELAKELVDYLIAYWGEGYPNGREPPSLSSKFESGWTSAIRKAYEYRDLDD